VRALRDEFTLLFLVPVLHTLRPVFVHVALSHLIAGRFAAGDERSRPDENELHLRRRATPRPELRRFAGACCIVR
jgi:hypothetical protein